MDTVNRRKFLTGAVATSATLAAAAVSRVSSPARARAAEQPRYTGTTHS